MFATELKLDSLRRRGRVASAGPVTIRARRAESGDRRPPRVAFAIPRGVGSAPCRNRVRRRLREILRRVVRLEPRLLPSGVYLVQVRPPAGQLGFAELEALTLRALEGLQPADGGGR